MAVEYRLKPVDRLPYTGYKGRNLLANGRFKSVLNITTELHTTRPLPEDVVSVKVVEKSLGDLAVYLLFKDGTTQQL